MVVELVDLLGLQVDTRRTVYISTVVGISGAIRVIEYIWSNDSVDVEVV